jgi:hypothetical protein
VTIKYEKPEWFNGGMSIVWETLTSSGKWLKIQVTSYEDEPVTISVTSCIVIWQTVTLFLCFMSEKLKILLDMIFVCEIFVLDINMGFKVVLTTLYVWATGCDNSPFILI